MSKIPGGRVADARPAQMPPFTNFCRRKEAYASTEKANEKDSAYMVEKKNDAGKKANKSIADRATSGPISQETSAYSAAKPVKKATFERKTAQKGIESPVTA
jgi:hypothetical protein